MTHAYLHACIDVIGFVKPCTHADDTRCKAHRVVPGHKTHVQPQQRSPFKIDSEPFVANFSSPLEYPRVLSFIIFIVVIRYRPYDGGSSPFSIVDGNKISSLKLHNVTFER